MCKLHLICLYLKLCIESIRVEFIINLQTLKLSSPKKLKLFGSHAIVLISFFIVVRTEKLLFIL